jgi:iron complex outermembrane receptor protein
VLPFPRSIGEVVFNANYYKSSSFELVGYTAQGYDLVNARLDWTEVFGTRVSVGAFARNLFNEEYVSGPAITALGLPLTSIIPGDPRAYGAQVRMEFGGK